MGHVPAWLVSFGGFLLSMGGLSRLLLLAIVGALVFIAGFFIPFRNFPAVAGVVDAASSIIVAITVATRRNPKRAMLVVSMIIVTPDFTKLYR